MRVVYLHKRSLSALLTVAAVAVVLVVASRFGSNLPAAAEPYYQGVEDGKRIALTINVDWGEEFLPDILKVLAEHQVQATFFLTGRWTSEHPELAKEIAAAGHELGNHAYSHTSPNSLDQAGNEEEILRTAEAIKQATGVTTTLYAPPSGERDEQVLAAAEALGYRTILWSIDTIDWKRPEPQVISERVLKKAHAGGIILAHPTNPTLSALPTILERLQDDGYTFVTVGQLINEKTV